MTTPPATSEAPAQGAVTTGPILLTSSAVCVPLGTTVYFPANRPFAHEPFEAVTRALEGRGVFVTRSESDEPDIVGLVVVKQQNRFGQVSGRIVFFEDGVRTSMFPTRCTLAVRGQTANVKTRSGFVTGHDPGRIGNQYWMSFSRLEDGVSAFVGELLS